MKRALTIAILSCSLITVTSSFLSVKAEEKKVILPLETVTLETSLPGDTQLWGDGQVRGDRQLLLQAISYSLKYLRTPSAVEAYRDYPIPGVTRDRVIHSLLRFRQLLLNSKSAEELQRAVEREFAIYQSVGADQDGTVTFTGYFEPIYPASTTPTAEYRYPLYGKPKDLQNWSKPHLNRLQIEGEDGLLGASSPLSGLELVWLRDRLEAYLIQVQGSARLELTDGKIMTVGYAGNTDYPYVSLGKELVNDGKFTLEQLSLPVLIDYFRQHPLELNEYIPRNQRFIFFEETNGAPPLGSLGVPVTAERSIATDKSLMPPGALAIIQTQIPSPNSDHNAPMPLVTRYVLDQDTGSAIKGAGRVDIFMGTGQQAGDRAGMIHNTGQLYYLLIKE